MLTLLLVLSHAFDLSETKGFFSKSSGPMLASHAVSHGCVVVRALFRTASRIASFLGDHLPECQKNAAKIRIPPRTFTHTKAIFRSFPGLEITAPSSSSPTTASPSWLQPPLAFFSTSRLFPNKPVRLLSWWFPSHFLIFSCFPSALQSSCFISFILISPPIVLLLHHFQSFFCLLVIHFLYFLNDMIMQSLIYSSLHLAFDRISKYFGSFIQHLNFLTCVLTCSFQLHRPFGCASHLAQLATPALTHNQFCTNIKRRKSHLPDSPRLVSLCDVCHSSCLSFPPLRLSSLP